jgi:hypothetical protein
MVDPCNNYPDGIKDNTQFVRKRGSPDCQPCFNRYKKEDSPLGVLYNYERNREINSNQGKSGSIVLKLF